MRFYVSNNMSLEERVREAEEEARRSSAAAAAAPWLILGIIAVLLLELFGHPLLAASVFCIKFGWSKLKTGWWLLRTDPDRGRAWAAGLLYVAAGFWKAAVVNYAMFTAGILYTLLSGEPAWPQRPENAPAPDFIDDPLTPWAAPTVAAHVLEFVLGAAALSVAYIHHQKLWLGSAATAARRNGVWPPRDESGSNWLRWSSALLLASVPATLWCIGVGLMALIPPPPAVNLTDWKTAGALSVVFVILLALPPLLAAMCTQDKQNRYLLAHSAAECWGAADAR